MPLSNLEAGVVAADRPLAVAGTVRFPEIGEVGAPIVEPRRSKAARFRGAAARGEEAGAAAVRRREKVGQGQEAAAGVGAGRGETSTHLNGWVGY